jgi:hypothetical protein
MVRINAKFGLLAAAFLAVGYLTPAPVKAGSASPITTEATDFSAARRGGAGAGRAGGGRNVDVNRNVNVNRTVNRNVNLNRRVGVVVRPVRVWAPRPYYGAIVGGVALGTIIAASAVGAAPVAPAPNMCWYWVDSAQIQGYWDYCTPPY